MQSDTVELSPFGFQACADRCDVRVWLLTPRTLPSIKRGLDPTMAS